MHAGADPNATNDAGETPLHKAAASPSPRVSPVLSYLLQAGAVPNARDHAGSTPLLTILTASVLQDCLL